jgi:hypothetical protein
MVSVTESEKYQKEISGQYKKRVSKISIEEVVGLLRKFGISNVDASLIHEAVVGNMSATYIAADYVIKIGQDKDTHSFLANKIVFDRFGSRLPIVNVLAYDFFEKTNYEILIMKKAVGTLLLDDIFDLSEESLAFLFKQLLQTIRELLNLSFKTFGKIKDEKQCFPSYSEFLKRNFLKHAQKIKSECLCSEQDLERITKYFLNNVSVFDSEKAVFVHTDLHMGNIIHTGEQISAIIDFDSAMTAAPVRVLPSIIGFIDNPGQFVEGTKDYQKYKGKNFRFLLPVLKKELSFLFNDQVVKKLNLVGIGEAMMWVSENWSTDWNREMIKNIVENELADSDEKLRHTYYGKILGI